MSKINRLTKITIIAILLLTFSTYTLGREIIYKPKIIKQHQKHYKAHKRNHQQKFFNILVTYYTNSKHDCGNSRGISASGLNLIKASRKNSKRIHYVSAPKDVKFGTKLFIKGVGECLVVDRGSAIKYKTVKGKRHMKIDVFVYGAKHKELMKMGLLKTQGYVLKQGK